MADVPLSQIGGAMIPEDVREMFERIPQGTILFTCKELKARMTEPQDGQGTSRLVLELEMDAQEPKEVTGQSHRESFYVGTDEDPMAQKPETWRDNGGRLAHFCDKAGFNIRGASLQQIAGWLVGRPALGDIQHWLMSPVDQHGRPNPNAFTQTGTQKSRTRARWLEIGSATPVLYEDQEPKGVKAGGQTTAAAPQAVPAYGQPAGVAPAPAQQPMAPPRPGGAMPMPQGTQASAPPGFPAVGGGGVPPSAPPPRRR